MKMTQDGVSRPHGVSLSHFDHKYLREAAFRVPTTFSSDRTIVDPMLAMAWSGRCLQRPAPAYSVTTILFNCVILACIYTRRL